jgi:hypothetical protein
MVLIVRRRVACRYLPPCFKHRYGQRSPLGVTRLTEHILIVRNWHIPALSVEDVRDGAHKKTTRRWFFHHINSLAAVFVCVTHMREQDHVADAWRVGQ